MKNYIKIISGLLTVCLAVFLTVEMIRTSFAPEENEILIIQGSEHMHSGSNFAWSANTQSASPLASGKILMPEDYAGVEVPMSNSYGNPYAGYSNTSLGSNKGNHSSWGAGSLYGNANNSTKGSMSGGSDLMAFAGSSGGGDVSSDGSMSVSALSNSFGASKANTAFTNGTEATIIIDPGRNPLAENQIPVGDGAAILLILTFAFSGFRKYLKS